MTSCAAVQQAKLTMLDPSILVGPGTPQTATGAPLPDVQATIKLAEEAESRSRSLAAAIEMLSQLDDSNHLDEAANQTVLLLRDILAARRVLLLWRGKSRRGLTVIADSEPGNDDNKASEYRLAVAAGEEVAARGPITLWPVGQSDQRHPAAGSRSALLAVGQLAKGLSARRLTGLTLTQSSHRDRGVLLAIDPSTTDATNLLRAVATPLTSKLAAVERLQPAAWESTIRGLVDLVRGPSRNTIVAIAAAIALVMLLPTGYRVSAELELQPVKHRFVAVPFDGPLESAHVRPGDMVQQGDLLATINPREIEYELAGIRAEWNRAIQEKKGRMAEHDVAGSKLAALESDRLRLQSDLLQYRRDNLEIRSPIAGVVVSGDLKESEGMPMSRGQTLFEIAPLGQMVVEIAVPEADVTHVRKGMDVNFYVHALPNRTMTGKIARLHPRAELRNHDNAFIAEVNVRDDQNVLRPGMRGQAKIFSTRHPLAWNLFHKAYHALRHALGC